MQTLIVSSMSPSMPPGLISYLLDRIRNPDPGSEFEQRTFALRSLPEKQWIPGLMKAGYRGIVSHDKGVIIGHLFYQQRREPESLHVFTVNVDPSRRRQGIATRLIGSFLEQVVEQGMTLARLTAGGSPEMRALCTKIENEQSDLPCITRPDLGIGWVEVIH